MKYTVTSGSQFYTIGTANTIEEAMKLYDQHLDHDPSDDACIWDENHHDVFDYFEFVGNIIDNDTTGELVSMTAEDASITLEGWKESGVEIPAGLTAEALQQVWNYILEEDDEASYQETIREASDPLLEKFQLALDCAVLDRDEAGKKWLACEDYDHGKYVRYQQAQSYLEGLTNGIFVAGYDILTSSGGKMTVTKREEA